MNTGMRNREVSGEAADPQHLDPLLEGLHHWWSRSTRSASIEGLRRFGPTAVDRITPALRDTRPWVRAEAAETLGEIGHPSAIPALNTALRDTMVGGTRRRQAMWAWSAAMVTLTLVSITAIFMLAPFDAQPVGSIGLFYLALVTASLVFGASILWARRWNRCRVAIAEALTLIAHASGSAELRTSLADLEVLAGGGWGQSSTATRRAREAVETIRDVTSGGSHPIPAAAPPHSTAELPIPTREHDADSDRLPVAAHNRGDR